MKGIILAGGYGTRLYPITKAVSKHLLPVYDKPMIYYPLSVLMLGGIRDIYLISSPQAINQYKYLLGDGTQWGIKLHYRIQNKPRGIADAFLLLQDELNNTGVSLILGDNLFFGHGLTDLIEESINIVETKNKAVIWSYPVNNPESYGIVELKENIPVRIVEKPANPRSNWAVVGLYFYPPDVWRKVRKLIPSSRGELEITDLNNLYLHENRIELKLLGRGYAWLDMGTAENLLIASQFVETLEKRTGLKIACLEEIAYRKGFITKEELIDIASRYPESEYGAYLKKLAKDEIL